MALLKKIPLISLIIIGSVCLSACKLTKPTDPKDICAQMKRQLTYYRSTHDIEAKWTTNLQKQEFERKMRDYHCEMYN